MGNKSYPLTVDFDMKNCKAECHLYWNVFGINGFEIFTCNRHYCFNPGCHTHKVPHPRSHLDCVLVVCMYLGLLAVSRAWCNEMMARITADDLARDVAGAETMVNRHKENKTEIDSRNKDFVKFTQTGTSLINQGHFLSKEVSTVASSI